MAYEKKVENKIELEIYLLGYENEGESIVVFIRIDDYVDYSMLIDSYEVNHNNKAINLLQNEGLSQFDFICWTHPHKDHSKGLDTVLKLFSSEQTVVVYPSYHKFPIKKGLWYKGSLKNIKDRINRKKLAASYSTIEASDNKNLVRKEYYKSDEKFIFEIKSISPRSAAIDYLENNIVGKGDPNLFSICLLMSFGYYNFFFGSDVQNHTIKLFEKIDLRSLDYVKVPHHGSSTSNMLISKINNLEYKLPVLGTTTIYKDKLPENEVINDYKKENIKICSTNGDGVIKTVVPISDTKNPKLITTLQGKAIVL